MQSRAPASAACCTSTCGSARAPSTSSAGRPDRAARPSGKEASCNATRTDLVALLFGARVRDRGCRLPAARDHRHDRRPELGDRTRPDPARRDRARRHARPRPASDAGRGAGQAGDTARVARRANRLTTSVERYLVTRAGGAVLALDDALRETLRTDDELHAACRRGRRRRTSRRAHVAVVVEHGEPDGARARRTDGRPARPRRPPARPGPGTATRCTSYGAIAARPDEAVLVVVLLDDRRDDRATRRCRSSPSPSGAARRARRCSARRARPSTSCRSGTRARPRCRGRPRAAARNGGTCRR